MPAIDVRRVEDPNRYENLSRLDDLNKLRGEWELLIGNRSYRSSGSMKSVYISHSEPPVDVTVDKDEILQEIKRCRFSDISANIKTLGRPIFHLVDHPHLFHMIQIERVSSDTYKLRIALGVSSDDWKMPWSSSQYRTEFLRIVGERYTQFKVEDSEWIYQLSITVDHPTNIIEDEVSTYRAAFQTIHEQVEASLKAGLSAQSVLMFFDFPEEVKVPCEQYLLYFAKFLKDLGVEAETALTNEAGRVLFTVTPVDESEALDSIRSALDVYLRLPSSPIGDATNESIAVQRLEANILRLRGDLKLAAAELQAKNTTIEAQRLIIDVKDAMLSGEILVGSVKDVTPQREDKEQLIDGLVAFSTYKNKGVEIYLGEVLRRLKNLFNRPT